MRKKQTIVAIMYDFDRTLSTEDMQNYGFIPSLGMSPKEFWAVANVRSHSEHMDGILAYMYTMVEQAKKKGLSLTREILAETGHKITFFPGVDTWFDRINAFGKENDVKVEHYVISSGLQEIISGCAIYDKFDKTFASEFLYDEEGNAIWPKAGVNYTNKTQFIYRINKNKLDIDDEELNAKMPDNKKRVSFHNMIYVGDGLSDVPCMKMVKTYGGRSIAVYNPSADKAAMNRVNELLKNDRVDFIYPSDYSEGSALEETVKNIIKEMAISDKLFNETKRLKEAKRIKNDIE